MQPFHESDDSTMALEVFAAHSQLDVEIKPWLKPHTNLKLTLYLKQTFAVWGTSQNVLAVMQTVKMQRLRSM